MRPPPQQSTAAHLSMRMARRPSMDRFKTSPVAARATFRCSKCRHEYEWAKEMIGKTAQCSCGQVLRVPMKPHADSAGAVPAREQYQPLGSSFIPQSMDM